MSIKKIGIVVAGGKGERLYPHSNPGRPKPFAQLDKNHTFVQSIVGRLIANDVMPNHIIVITTNDRQTKLAKEQLYSLGVISPNIYQIEPHYGYAGAMIKAAQFAAQFEGVADDTLLINTPADQFIDKEEHFTDALKAAEFSAKSGIPTIIGVKVEDINTFIGCGHAMYDLADTGITKNVTGFVEKPRIEDAKRLMRAGNTACNTGINVWRLDTILDAADSIDLERGFEIGTDELMSSFREIAVAIGDFVWHDCGTLEALWRISAKTPNHKNAILGEGSCERKDCLNSLFVAPRGITISARGIKDCSIVVEVINNRVFFADVAHASSQMVKELAKKCEGSDILRQSYSFGGAINNIIVPTPFSDEIVFGFVGSSGHIVTAYKAPNGEMIFTVTAYNANSPMTLFAK